MKKKEPPVICTVCNERANKRKAVEQLNGTHKHAVCNNKPGHRTKNGKD